MTRLLSPDSDEESVLFVDKVPPRYVKDLIPREVCTIEELQVFVVPIKVSRVNRKIIHQNPIMFYKADTIQQGRQEKERQLENKDGKNLDQEYVSIDTSLYSGKNQGRLLKKLNCPTSIPKTQMERSNKMWNATQKTVMGIDGQTKHTRGLGYHSDDDIRCASPMIHFNGCVEREPVTSPFNYFSCNMVADGSDEEGMSDDVKQAPQEIDDSKTQNTVDELVEVNLGTEEKPRPTYISASLSAENKNTLLALLREYVDCFAWSYEEMPGLSPEVAVHKLKIDPAIKPVKQAPRRMRIELEEKVVEETKKLIDAGFIREEENPEWVASIVPVKKKNGQIRICVDFRDLNKACPKDEFPLPVTEIIIDHTSSYEIFSFIDDYAGYNQIKMDEEDQKHTSFRTPMGVFCYHVMPFGLKNAGATYQRAMTKIFHDLIHKIVECYVDDLVVKATSCGEHLQHLRVVFDRLRLHALKLNPLKCAFMVSSGKFLGFVIRHRGIEIDPCKIKAIMEMPAPKNLKEVRGLQGRLAYIRRFIANLSGRVHPFTRLTKKDVPFKWDETCQQALDGIKSYLLNPPVLAAQIPDKELILYTTTLEGSLGALLAQQNEEGKENALYYLSRMLVGAESNYTPIERHCLALVFTVKKLRHYMMAHKIKLISRVDPLKYLMTKPMLTGRLARWAIILTEFDITFIPQKAIKGQALADFLAAHPIPDDSPLACEFPDEEILCVEENTPTWQLYFDGASSI